MNRLLSDSIHTLLNPCDFVVAGVSGGADSLAMLHYLKFGGHGLKLNILVCHVNHMLRGAESMRDQRHVEQLCREWELPLHVEQADIRALAAASGKSIEEAGRETRYRIFQELAGERGKIATAHTMSDSYETMLFHLTRGTGLKGLCGIPPVRGNIVRPLLKVTRAQVEEYCKNNKISYITDSTNTDIKYSRNKIRQEVIPKLLEINPNAEEQAANTAALLSEDAAFLERLARQNLADCRQGRALLLQNLSTEPAVRNRVLLFWLKENGGYGDFQTIDRIGAIAEKGCGKLNVGGNLFCEVKDKRLLLRKPTESHAYFEFCLTENKRIKMPSGNEYTFFQADREELPDIQELFKNSTYNLVDSQKIAGKLIIRQRRKNDKICINRRNITKSIKKLFNEEKIPLEMRQKLFLICDEHGIIFVEDFGIDRRVAPDSGTTRFWVIRKETSQ